MAYNSFFFHMQIAERNFESRLDFRDMHMSHVYHNLLYFTATNKLIYYKTYYQNNILHILVIYNINSKDFSQTMSSPQALIKNIRIKISY